MYPSPELLDQEADEERAALDKQVRRAAQAATYTQPSPPSDAEEWAKRKLSEEELIAATAIGELEGSRRKTYRPLMPNGIGYLRKMLGEIQPNRHPNLAALSRFQRLLIERGGRFKRKPTTLDRARLLDYSQMDKNQPIHAPWKPMLTVGTSEIILKIAIESNVAPATIMQILVVYGLEHLAREMRERGAAPAPKESQPRGPQHPIVAPAATPDLLPGVSRRTAYFPPSGD